MVSRDKKDTLETEESLEEKRGLKDKKLLENRGATKGEEFNMVVGSNKQDLVQVSVNRS